MVNRYDGPHSGPRSFGGPLDTPYMCVCVGDAAAGTERFCPTTHSQRCVTKEGGGEEEEGSSSAQLGGGSTPARVKLMKQLKTTMAGTVVLHSRHLRRAAAIGYTSTAPPLPT
eukprot:GHVU01168137.1.p1 GENE.GHVU01168137.1~~GHVU01168137.1.p1  ORF type:complete len:113 (+),score=12.66 GHVU01168137.1:102-440(+)